MRSAGRLVSFTCQSFVLTLEVLRTPDINYRSDLLVYIVLEPGKLSQPFTLSVDIVRDGKIRFPCLLASYWKPDRSVHVLYNR